MATDESTRERLARTLGDPHPREPLPGPKGESARAAGPEDAATLVDLYLEYLHEAGTPHRRDLVEWTVQVVTHDPLRGVLVVAERPGTGPIGMAALEAAASAVHGWMARLTALWVRPSERGHGVGRWLLAESLELARYHGLNHVECRLAAGVEPGRALLESCRFARSEPQLFSLDLHPLYDDFSGGDPPKIRDS